MKHRTHPSKKMSVVSAKDGSVSFKKWVFFNSHLYLDWNIDPKSLWKRPRKEVTTSRNLFFSFREHSTWLIKNDNNISSYTKIS